MDYTAHVDRFTAGGMPTPDALPDFIFDGPELHFPEKMNAVTYFLDRWIESGQGRRRAILAPDGTEWTYEMLAGISSRIARVLVEDCGVVPGNRVLLRGYNGPMMAACWVAVLKAGAVAVTTMPLYRSGELRFMIDKARVSVALCDARLKDDLHAACAGDSGVRTLLFNSSDGDSLESRMRVKPAQFDTVQTAALDAAIVGFTSGTTGRAKAALHTHRDLIATCRTFGERVLQPHAGDLFCGSPPLAFTFGLGGVLLYPLYSCAATLLLEKTRPEDLAPAIEAFRATVLFTAPMAYRAMCALPKDWDLSSLRCCVSAGEPLPAVTWEQWRAKTGVRIIDGIGSTEMLHIFIGSPAAESRPGSTGRVVPGYAAEIHDDAGNALPDGEIGRLAVKGPTGCKYLDDERQAIYVQRGWNYPGDAYRRDADGYYYYVARTDDMIIAAGYNISGPEVEQALLEHPHVAECAVVAKPQPERGTNIVKAYVVPAPGVEGRAEEAEELMAFCRGAIAPYKAPREVEFVPALPRTETGKVQRYKLRAQAVEGS